MRIFSYRNKRRAKLVLLTVAIAVLAVLVFCLCRFVYIQRYLVYSPDGVTVNYEQDLQSDRRPQSAIDPDQFPVTILSPEQSTAASSQTDDEMRQLSGFYVTTSMLQDVPAVQEALAEQESVSTLMFDMKSIFGNFYYTSGIPGTFKANVDIAAIEAMIEQLSQDESIYLIARIPSFSDNNYALDNQDQGLPLSSGALWMDSNGCYWLDPMEEDVQSFLAAIAEELYEIGFDEVVFTEFRFPDSENIVYTDEYTREEAVIQAALAIDEALEETPIRVSFNSSDPLVAQYTDRIYLQSESGSAVAALVAPLEGAVADTAAQIVFMTASRDTRFNSYGILRPLIEEDA